MSHQSPRTSPCNHLNQMVLLVMPFEGQLSMHDASTLRETHARSSRCQCRSKARSAPALEMDRHQVLRNRPLDKLPFPLESAPQLPQVPREQPPQYELNTTLGKDMAGQKNLMTLEKGPQILIPNDVFTGGFTLRKMRVCLMGRLIVKMSNPPLRSMEERHSPLLSGLLAPIKLNFQEPSRGSDPIVGPPTPNGRYPRTPTPSQLLHLSPLQ